MVLPIKLLLVKQKRHLEIVEKWSRGETLPRWHEAAKIFKITNNQVTGNDLYEEQIQRKKANL